MLDARLPASGWEGEATAESSPLPHTLHQHGSHACSSSIVRFLDQPAYPVVSETGERASVVVSATVVLTCRISRITCFPRKLQERLGDEFERLALDLLVHIAAAV